MDADLLVLRFDAPLMSFGGPVVDQEGVTDAWPALSMLTGLLGNALGWDHSDAERLQSLQERLVVGARRDRAGVKLVDYQTADLGQDFLIDTGWTTSGEAEGREGGPAARLGTHIRRRHYIADALYTVVMGLSARGSPTIDELESALLAPARPLFLGRKACLPSAPILATRIRGSASLRDALAAVPPVSGRRDPGELLAYWPSDGPRSGEASRAVYVTDERDWSNQLHVGRRQMVEGLIQLRPEPAS